VLQLTESLRTVAEASSPTDLLRGIGNWFFYGADRVGYSIDQASEYLRSDVVVFATFAIPVLALVAAGVVRWRHRAYFALLVVVGTVVGVGAWPYDDPSPYGALFKSFGDTAAGLALRNTPRVVPLIVLGIAALLAAGLGALSSRRQEVVAACVVGTLALVAFVPVWRLGYFSGGVDRANDVPAYWQDAAAALDRGGDATRVLEVPGVSFAAYRWGNTVEPVTPGLTDRPYVAREVLPAGTPPSVNLLDALDHRLQEGTFEPAAFAGYARLAGIGTIALRSDLQYERFDSPRPRLLWALLTDPLAPGLESPRVFGTPEPNRASPALNMLDNLELRIPVDAKDPPPVALFDVTDPVPIVHAAPSAQPVLLAGDAEGIVDAVAAGLIDGNQLVLESAALDRTALARVLRDGADLVLTDTNRRRSRHYFSRIRDATGYTERAGETAPRADDTFRLEPFPTARDSARTVVEQHGGTVVATDYAVSADRPANAVDGDPRTAWRVGGKAVGERLVLRPDTPVRTDHVTLAQLPAGLGDRSIEQARLRFDGGEAIDVQLGPDSFTPAGQRVSFPERDVRELEIEIEKVRVPELDTGLAVVGLTDVGLGDLRIRETVRLPLDLVRHAGAQADGHRLDVVLSRLRYDPGQLQDEELALDRRFVLPNARSFQVSGRARVDPNAPDTVLDDVMGTTTPGATFTSSDHLFGDLDARASRAFDGDPTTAWSPNFGTQQGRFVDVALAAPATVDRVDLTLVVDGRHSVPTQFTLVADGVPQRTFTIDPDGAADGSTATRRITVPFDPVRGSQFRLYVDEVSPTLGRTARDRAASVAPVGIAEVGLTGVPQPARPATLPGDCRDDLVEVNDAPVPVRIVGAAADARRGLEIEPCGAAVALDRGSNTLRSTPGLDTGIDVDRVVLSSDASGQATPPAVLGAPLDESGATVRVVDSSPAALDLSVRTDGRPFWLVLGQSADDGWEASVSTGAVGRRQVVNGFANGWLVTPSGAGTMDISLQWSPQRFVWFGFAVSIVAIVACLALVVVGWRRRNREPADGPPDTLADTPMLRSPFAYLGTTPSAGVLAALVVGAGVATALFSRPWIGVVVGVACVVAARVARARILLTAGAPLALALARITEFDDLAWLAVALLAADLATGWVRERRRPRTSEGSSPDAT
jgi:arabinofuranan 3-O-arabinosyltransferase